MSTSDRKFEESSEGELLEVTKVGGATVVEEIEGVKRVELVGGMDTSPIASSPTTM